MQMKLFEYTAESKDHKTRVKRKAFFEDNKTFFNLIDKWNKEDDGIEYYQSDENYFFNVGQANTLVAAMNVKESVNAYLKDGTMIKVFELGYRGVKDGRY